MNSCAPIYSGGACRLIYLLEHEKDGHVQQYSNACVNLDINLAFFNKKRSEQTQFSEKQLQQQYPHSSDRSWSQIEQNCFSR